MSPNQLLEDRAERGHPRGAANVWAAAIREADPAQAAHPNPWGRASFWLVGLAVAVVGIFGLKQLEGVAFDNEPATETAQQDEPDPMAGVLPASILVEGMAMQSVIKPIGPDEEPDSVSWDDSTGDFPDQTTFFGNPDSPFTHPILAIENPGNGGFRPWGLNLDGAGLDPLVDDMERIDGVWTVGEASDLHLLGSIEDQVFWSFDAWQFDFASGGQTITMQVAPTDGANEWTWISRLSRSSLANLRTEPIEVLGLDGVLVTSANGDDYVAWELDGFGYVARAGEVVGDTHQSRSVVDKVGSLVMVNRADWQAEVDRSGSFRTSSVFVPIGLVLLVLWTLSAIWFLYKGPRWLAALLPVAGFVLYAMAPTALSWLLLLGVLLAVWGYFIWRQSGNDDPADLVG